MFKGLVQVGVQMWEALWEEYRKEIRIIVIIVLL